MKSTLSTLKNTFGEWPAHNDGEIIEDFAEVEDEERQDNPINWLTDSNLFNDFGSDTYSWFGAEQRNRAIINAEIPNVEGPNIIMNNINNSLPNIQTITSVYFRDLDKHLSEKIEQADVVFGCVAWLTNKKVLTALSKIKGASILVQKEDFLRPDSKHYTAQELRKMYSNIHPLSKCALNWFLWFPKEAQFSGYSIGGADNFASVRCVGVKQHTQQYIESRQHNKFFIFSKLDKKENKLNHYAVWTGSFNPTENGTRSLENAVYIQSQTIAEQYFREYSIILGLSEPLNWECEWICPEYRIGT